MATEQLDWSGLPPEAPHKPQKTLRYADVAVTATANEFNGVYRNKTYHPADFLNTLDRALAAGVEKVMLTGMSLSDISVNLGIAKPRPGQCFVTIGVHPYHAAELDAGGPTYMEKLVGGLRDALALTPCPVAAFGELGLDYDRLNHAPKSVQIKAFKAQLDLFVENKWDLPLFLHCRAAFDDFVEIITTYLQQLPRRGLVHSFVGSAAQMNKLVELGFDIGVNGFSFKDRESLDMVAAIPLERLQIETDAPWGEIKSGSEVAKRYLANAPPLPPSKKRDKWDAAYMVKERNESCMIERVAYVVAGLKGITVDEVAEAAWKNSTRMFELGLVNESN
ncbi:Mg-dependent DNase [Hypomontagnella monticulosa]|nr:Mg-dependent DNase [Hypomontagnella monticulosa]